MARIPIHTIEDAPAASRPFLQKIVDSTPSGRPANLHSQMAHSPAVLTAYSSLRAVLSEQSSFDAKTGAALTLAAATGIGNDYMVRIASRLAQMNGWTDEQVAALKAGAQTDDPRIDVLAGLAREASGHQGQVTDATWNAALQAGWSDEQLADAFAHIGATAFTAFFLNFAQTELDAASR